ncbi:MAG: sodium:calcium antiporter [Kiritimatiellia bacterium]
MILSGLLFALGIALLWGGTETVLRRVPKLATWLRVSPLVVTIMLVAVITSLPEFCVSLFASLRGQPAAAVGNIVGSNFVTLTFVAGLCALWRPIVVGPTLRERESSWMILSAALLLVLAMDGMLSRTDGLLLLAAYFPYFRSTLDEARKQRQESTATAEPHPWLDIFLFLVGVGMVVLGSNWIVEYGSAMARQLGMSDLLIGVTFYAFGTSLPELAIALGAVIRRQADVTLGEIYASNIFTGLAVAGALCLIRPLAVAPLIVSRDLPMLIFAGVLLQLFVTSGGRFVRSEAAIMVAVFALFLAAQFMGFSISLP